MRTTAGSEFLGIEIGGTKLQIVAGSPNAGITCRWRAAADRAGGGAAIAKQIAAGLKEMTATARPAAIGVGFGGPVDWRSGTICKSHQIEGWGGFPLAEWISRETGVPVAVDNDANVGVLGEWSQLVRSGATPRDQLDPLFYVTLGSGVGGGLVVD